MQDATSQRLRAGYLMLLGGLITLPITLVFAALTETVSNRVMFFVAAIVIVGLLGSPWLQLAMRARYMHDAAYVLALFLRAGVCTIMLVCWIVIGLAAWIRMLFVACAVLSLETLQIALRGRRHRPSFDGPAFDSVGTFWARGVGTILRVAMDPDGLRAILRALLTRI